MQKADLLVNPVKNEDLKLAAACNRKEKLAMDRLYRGYAPKILSICRRYAANDEEALDCLHDGFLKVFENIGRYEGKGSLYAWVKVVVVNNTINWAKARVKVSALDEDPMDEPDDEWEEPEIDAERLIQLITRLPEGYRMVLNLYVFERLSHDEIAAKLGISSATSRTQLFKARKRLKEMWKKS